MNFDLNEVEAENTGWKPLKAGLDIPAVLESVEMATTKEGDITEDLTFNFKGTAPGNTGTFTHRIWANTFDPEHEYFNEKKAERTLAAIKHIAAAYLPQEGVALIKGANWKELSAKTVEVLNAKVTSRPCTLKVLLNGKNNATFPTFPDFISTDLTPDRSFNLNHKINPNTGRPWESITPVAQDGENAGSGAAATAPSPFEPDANAAAAAPSPAFE